ncbi:MAG TPA: hypothetical protein VGK27_05535 [Candidatus Deferrimicrobiaceae bacterium]
MTTQCNINTELSNIINVLASIWQTPDMPRESIVNIVDEFNSYDWLLLASMDAVSLWGPNSGKFIYKQREVMINSNDGYNSRVVGFYGDKEDRSESELSYIDFNKHFYVDGLKEETKGIARDPIVLLELLSYLKYHIDSIAMLPENLRQNRFDSIATRFNQPVGYLHNMVNWLSEIK